VTILSTSNPPGETVPRLLLSAWVAPMDRPLIRDGGVVIRRGRIVAVGTGSILRRDHPAATVEDLGQSILLPGLVNAHAHLELSLLKPGEAPASFVEWVQDLMRRTAPELDPALFAREGVAEGLKQCARFGVTSVGDISRQCEATRPLLNAAAGARVVSYGEVLAMASRRNFLEPRLAAAADASQASERVRIGISPHAPYSVEAHGYRRCLEVARDHGLPLATHLAETPYEAEFLASHAGPFRELWRFLGAWDEDVPKFDGGPIRYANALGLLDFPALLAHVNYCDDDELALLARRQASVVYCPRTHAYFGHPPHRWREMLAAGINVALGTDSCASSPDLNLVDDLRLVHRLAPDVAAEEIWKLATLRAAVAIQMSGEIGSLTPGKRADLVAFPAQGTNPLQDILEIQILPLRVWTAEEIA